MNLRSQVKSLETRARQQAERELCPHLPQVIHWADGSVENDAPHECGRPRLKILVGYTADSDRRMQNALLDLFDEHRRKYPDVPPEMLVGWVNEDCSPTPETRAALLERIRAESHEHTR